MVSKRSYPYGEEEQGTLVKTYVTEKLYNSTVERMPKVYGNLPVCQFSQIQSNRDS